MTPTWNGAEPPDVPRLRFWQIAVVVIRAILLVSVTYFGMIFVLLFNFIERFRHLGISHAIICLWGRFGLWVCGLTLKTSGTPMEQGGAIVANHSSWIDIFTMLAADKVHFVAKAEVSRWPVIGILSRQIDPVYIDRRRTAAKEHLQQLQDRLLRGDRLCFFPEGTSTDGLQVIPFKSTLFNTFLTPEIHQTVWVQPVSVIYHPPVGLPRAFYGWWGDMAMGSHLKSVFGLSFGGVVETVFHPPLRAADFADRKALSSACEAAVRAGFEAHFSRPEVS